MTGAPELAAAMRAIRAVGGPWYAPTRTAIGEALRASDGADRAWWALTAHRWLPPYTPADVRAAVRAALEVTARAVTG